MLNDNVNRLLASALALLSIAAMNPATVSAQGVTIELQDIFLGPGGTASMDIMISPTAGSQTLNSFEVPFLISASSPGQLSSLQFADPHDESFLTDAASDYLFFGNSDAVNLMMPVNATSTVSEVNDFVTAFDLSFDFSDVDLTTPKLLTRLQFSNIVAPGTGPLAVIGDSFQVSVDELDVLIDNVDGDFITATVAGPGSVTVVPEPGTFAACAAFAGIAALRRRRRS